MRLKIYGIKTIKGSRLSEKGSCMATILLVELSMSFSEQKPNNLTNSKFSEVFYGTRHLENLYC